MRILNVASKLADDVAELERKKSELERIKLDTNLESIKIRTHKKTNNEFNTIEIIEMRIDDITKEESEEYLQILEMIQKIIDKRIAGTKQQLKEVIGKYM